jgi:hypothetical protein
MIQKDQTFYYQVWVTSSVPDFATIYVLDTSGSMSDDKEQVKCGMSGEIYDYNNYIYSLKDSKIYVYSASKLSTMNVEASVFGSIKFGEATSKSIWTAVDSFVTTAMKRVSGSECMVTNMYYSIAHFRKKVFTGNNAEPIGKRCNLSAATFLMFTDEDIFTNDTLDDIEKLTS